MYLKEIALLSCISLLGACGGGSSSDEMTDDMEVVNVGDDAPDPLALMGSGYEAQLAAYDNLIMEAALLAQAGANLPPATGFAQYTGIAQLTESTTAPGAILPELLYAATGEVSIVANIGDGTLSGTAGNFYESSNVFHSSGLTTGTAIDGTLVIDENGASGTLTKSSGEVATYTLTTDAGYTFIGSEGDYISAAATGTSAAEGRNNVDVLGDFIASR